MTARTNEDNVVEIGERLSQLPTLSKDQMALALLLLGSLGTLVALRKGVKGIGPIELTGSTVSAVEFAAMLVLVGTTFRLIMVNKPESSLSRALAFVY